MARSMPLRQSAQSEILADKLEKPSLDDRSYRIVKLPNKLEALVIHDPDTDKASAAMDVNVGSFSDEDDMPGMAHAVEHLLFMGTKKYPKENEYSSYLSNNSGYSNAFTASCDTNYFFEVSAHAGEKATNGTSGKEEKSPLHGALDRFAQFFIEPLFLEETLDRELRAVDSENKKNLQSDTWRLNQLSRMLANPKHPYAHFSTGSLKTLKDDPLARGVRIRDEFMRFHREQYSANRMKLVVLGRESLDTLQSWVEDMFAGVVNKDLPKLRWDDVPLFTRKEMHSQTFAKPVMNSRSLDLTFTYQDEDNMYDTHPGSYLSHLLGHEGPGSILAYVKDNGWANSLNAGSYTLWPGGGVLDVSLSLTPDGLKEYRKVAKVVFQYMSILRESEPQPWIGEEINKMNEVDFKFKQKSPASSTTSGLSGKMQKPLPRERLLSGGRMLRKFDAEAIRNATKFLDSDNFNMMIVSQEDFPEKNVQREHWYGTEYVLEKIPEDFLSEIKKAIDSTANDRPKELFLPGKNEFIPSRLEVERKPVKEPAKAPKLIRNDANVRCWFKKDDQFWVPKANLTVSLRNPVMFATPRNGVMSMLCVSLVDDTLTEYSYNAELAGLDYGLEAMTRGLKVSINGYNDKMSVLLEKVLTTLRDLHVREDRFNIIKERMKRGFENSGYSTPYYQIGGYVRYLVTERNWHIDQYLEEIDSISVEDLRSFHPNLLKQVHIETFVHGNLYREDALKLTDLVESTIKTQPLPGSQWPIGRSAVLSPGDNFVWSSPLKDPSNINHCIQYLLQVGEKADRARFARLSLFAQMTSEPAFDQLRTKEQLGYVVFSNSAVHQTTLAYHVLIQSERTPDYLEQRVDAFLSKFGNDLAKMTQEEFESHKRSLINRRLEKLENLGQESNRFWSHISDEFFRFEEADEDVELTRPLTKEDMMEFYDTFINPASKKRSKLSVHLVAQASAVEQAKEMSPAERTQTMSALLSEGLSTQGLSSSPDKLTSRLEGVDIASGDQVAILDAVSTHMKDDLQASDEQTTSFIDQARVLLPATLPSLGVNVKPSEALVNGDAVAPTIAKAVNIEDVRVWKASMMMSKGPVAVKDISGYEDREAKL
ncbi:MAG: Insulinase (Peptidase M16) [Chrysothrix sp. TS-e1954]|nr:MAG: Insulinase (Peptidase M16) [Chrysothrix sp. TS-e1954]